MYGFDAKGIQFFGDLRSFHRIPFRMDSQIQEEGIGKGGCNKAQGTDKEKGR